MKFHRPVLSQVVSALAQIFGLTPDGRSFHADKVIERLFQGNRQLGSRDRKFIAEATYDIVRWWRLLSYCAKVTSPRPDTAEIWRILGAWLVLSEHEVPSWPEFREISADTIAEFRSQADSHPAVRESMPDWLYDLGKKELGEKWDTMLVELNQQAPVVLRSNRLKISRDQLMRELERESVQTEFAPDTEDGLILKERRNVFTTEAFKLGYFEVQDGASQQAAPLMSVEPGLRVIDGCAGAGGKTLHLAALMKNKGKIIALDIHQKRLEELRRRCARAGADIVESRLIESLKTVKRLEETADRVLLDVPCTGLGVLRRNPDTKWKLQPDELPRLQALQAEILSNYSRMVKKGGRLVYSTCSVLPSENEHQVRAFLEASGGEWKLIKERRFEPGAHGYDGFFAAAMERI